MGVAEPPGSPRTLVRSCRTVSPSPAPGRPGHRRSALCCPDPTGHPVVALASILPFGAPTFLDKVTPRRDHPTDSPSTPVWRGADAAPTCPWPPREETGLRQAGQHLGTVGGDEDRVLELRGTAV